jgi:hypothetical protein
MWILLPDTSSSPLSTSTKNPRKKGPCSSATSTTDEFVLSDSLTDQEARRDMGRPLAANARSTPGFIDFAGGPLWLIFDTGSAGLGKGKSLVMRRGACGFLVRRKGMAVALNTFIDRLLLCLGYFYLFQSPASSHNNAINFIVPQFFILR